MHFFKDSNRWHFVAGSSFDAKVVQCSVQINTWVALLHCNDGLDELARWSLWARLCSAASRKQPSILSLPEQAMKFQQR